MKKETFFTFILRIFSSTGQTKRSEKSEPEPFKNIWGTSGRKAQMDMRALLQTKPFTSSSKFSK